MVLERHNHIERIKRALTFIASDVTISGKLNLTDGNIHAENFYRDFLNRLFGYNLQSLNKNSSNFTAIDLGDKDLRLAIQVTSNNSLPKIRTTVDKFNANKWYKDFDELIFLRIGSHNTKHRKARYGSKGKIEVEIPDCIIGVKDLLSKVLDLELGQLKILREFLQKEIPFPGDVATKASNQFVDIEVENQLLKIRQLRYFNGSSTSVNSKRLLSAIKDGDLSGCSQGVREKAYSLCARYIASTDLEKSNEVFSQITDHTELEAQITKAYLISKVEGSEAGIKFLPNENIPQLNSVRLFLGTQDYLRNDNLNWDFAYNWINQAGFTIQDFDSDGKGRYLQVCLNSENWNDAYESIQHITDLDYQNGGA